MIDFRRIFGVRYYEKNFSLAVNMQIPQENTYSEMPVNGVHDKEMEKLSESYKIHNAQLVREFILNNNGLLQYISEITPIVNNYFPNYQKCLTFCRDPEFGELDDITIYINSFMSSFDEDWEKLDKLERELFYLQKFPTKIKGLVSLDLWLA